MLKPSNHGASPGSLHDNEDAPLLLPRKTALADTHKEKPSGGGISAGGGSDRPPPRRASHQHNLQQNNSQTHRTSAGCAISTATTPPPPPIEKSRSVGSSLKNARNESAANLRNLQAKWSSVRIRGTGFKDSRKSVVKIEQGCNGIPQTGAMTASKDFDNIGKVTSDVICI